MICVPLDTVFNLAWAAISVAALAGFAVLERKRPRGSRRTLRWQRLSAVVLVTVSIFPSVSYSDDLVTLSFLQSRWNSRGGFGAPEEEDGHQSRTSLARQLLSLEHCEIPDLHFAFAAASWIAVAESSATSPNLSASQTLPGRAPPLT